MTASLQRQWPAPAAVVPCSYVFALVAETANTTISTYATAGRKYAVCRPAESAITPYTYGRIAPPTMARHNKPDVAAGAAVERSSVDVKITGNMIELNR